MKYVYAALLLHSTGQEITEDNLSKVIESTGDEPDLAQIKSLTSALADVDIDGVISAPVETAAPQPSAAAPQPQPGEDGEEAETEEGEEEEGAEEEESVEGLGSLFG